MQENIDFSNSDSIPEQDQPFQTSIQMSVQPILDYIKSLKEIIAKSGKTFNFYRFKSKEELIKELNIFLGVPPLDTIGEMRNKLLEKIPPDLKKIAEELSLQVIIIGLDPLYDDLFKAEEKDVNAAARLAAQIHWSPNQWQREAIRLRARNTGKTPETCRQEALLNGVLQALKQYKEEKLPVVLAPKSTWVYKNDTNLETICPNDLSTKVYWEWIQEEAARAAGLWIIEHPYASVFVVTEPPSEIRDLHLVRFTSDSENVRLDVSRGRPVGSSMFANREAFLKEVKMAAAIIRHDGNKVTQERVAAVLSNKGLVGVGNSDFQLRRWTLEFGFKNWRDLLSQI